MSWFLVVIPAWVIIGSVLMYRFIGRKELLKFDLVQFVYALVLTPMVFVWGKILLYLLLKNGANGESSNMSYLIIDSSYSVIFMYIFGFGLLHSLTKSISLKVSQNPVYDIFHHLEYFHLWLSHLVFFGGGLVIFTTLSFINLAFPLQLDLNQPEFYLMASSGLVAGWMGFMAIWLSNPRQKEGHQFMRIMKLLIGFLFTGHVAGYLILEPSLSAPYLVYWWNSMNLTVMMVAALLSYRSARAKNWFERFSDKLKHPGFEFRMQLKKV